MCEPAVPNFKAHPVVGHKENGESIFRYIYTDIQKELTVKLRQSIEVYQSVELTEESRMALGLSLIHISVLRCRCPLQAPPQKKRWARAADTASY